MRRSDFLLCVLDAFGGSIEGRTLLQKRCFFVALLLKQDNLYGFRAHYYGPYSPAIDETLAELVSLGLVDERRIGFGAVGSEGFEIRRHDYRLTPDGRAIVESFRDEHSSSYKQIEEVAERIIEAGNPGYMELSVAAKAWYIIRSENRPMTLSEITNEARGFGWNVDASSLSRSAEFLRKLDLVSKGVRQ